VCGAAGAAMTDDDLIVKWIEPNPNKPWPDEVWLKGYAISVWAIVGELRDPAVDPLQLAAECRVPPDAIKAARAYYRRHQCVIDNRLLANA